jgi:hypothetical protein
MKTIALGQIVYKASIVGEAEKMVLLSPIGALMHLIGNFNH